MSNNNTDKMNILTVLVNLRNDIKNWCTYHFNRKLDNTFAPTENNKFIVTDNESKIVSVSSADALEQLGIIVRKGEPATLEEGKIYFIYD